MFLAKKKKKQTRGAGADERPACLLPVAVLSRWRRAPGASSSRQGEGAGSSRHGGGRDDAVMRRTELSVATLQSSHPSPSYLVAGCRQDGASTGLSTGRRRTRRRLCRPRASIAAPRPPGTRQPSPPRTAAHRRVAGRPPARPAARACQTPAWWALLPRREPARPTVAPSAVAGAARAAWPPVARQPGAHAHWEGRS